jgi:hypothetical protein
LRHLRLFPRPHGLRGQPAEALCNSCRKVPDRRTAFNATCGPLAEVQQLADPATGTLVFHVTFHLQQSFCPRKPWEKAARLAGPHGCCADLILIHHEEQSSEVWRPEASNSEFHLQ